MFDTMMTTIRNLVTEEVFIIHEDGEWTFCRPKIAGVRTPIKRLVGHNNVTYARRLIFKNDEERNLFASDNVIPRFADYLDLARTYPLAGPLTAEEAIGLMKPFYVFASPRPPKEGEAWAENFLDRVVSVPRHPHAYNPFSSFYWATPSRSIFFEGKSKDSYDRFELHSWKSIESATMHLIAGKPQNLLETETVLMTPQLWRRMEEMEIEALVYPNNKNIPPLAIDPISPWDAVWHEMGEPFMAELAQVPFFSGVLGERGNLKTYPRPIPLDVIEGVVGV